MSYDQIQMLSGLIGLLLFIGIFLGVIFWTFRPNYKEEHDAHARIPLNEE